MCFYIILFLVASVHSLYRRRYIRVVRWLGWPAVLVGWRTVADPKILKKGGAEDNLSVMSLFIANVHNEVYAFYTEKAAFWHWQKYEHPPILEFATSGEWSEIFVFSGLGWVGSVNLVGWVDEDKPTENYAARKSSPILWGKGGSKAAAYPFTFPYRIRLAENIVSARCRRKCLYVQRLESVLFFICK